MTTISYSNGQVIENAVIQIWDDRNNPRPGYFRAYWCADGNKGTSGSPVIGYCSPGGSHKTIRACVAELRRLHYHDPIYHNGKLL